MLRLFFFFLMIGLAFAEDHCSDKNKTQLETFLEKQSRDELAELARKTLDQGARQPSSEMKFTKKGKNWELVALNKVELENFRKELKKAAGTKISLIKEELISKVFDNREHSYEKTLYQLSAGIQRFQVMCYQVKNCLNEKMSQRGCLFVAPD